VENFNILIAIRRGARTHTHTHPLSLSAIRRGNKLRLILRNLKMNQANSKYFQRLL